jgi:multiple sugar transport system permease protein
MSDLTAVSLRRSRVVGQREKTRWWKSALVSLAVTVVVAWLAYVFLLPFYEQMNASLGAAAREPGQPSGPYIGKTFIYQDQTLNIYKVPQDGALKELALLEPGRASSVFIDPSNPSQKIEYQGSYRALDRIWLFYPRFENYAQAWEKLPGGFLRGLFNTFMVAALSTLGVVLSSVLTAYGLARFNLPGKDILLSILTMTMMLPTVVLFVPQYIMFFSVGWIGTWLPLIVPAFFGSAYSIFLLRQFFLAIPREFDEAAKVDGANPLQVLWFILLPLIRPAIIAVAIIHFIYVWNDFFYPTLYLAGKTDLMPVSVLIRMFSSSYGSSDPHLISAASVIATLIPMLLFLVAQRPFVRAITMPGLDK